MGRAWEVPGLDRATPYQAIVVLGLQIDGSYYVYPHQALLREILSVGPNQELARGLGSLWILRKGVDPEKALWDEGVLGTQPSRKDSWPEFRREGQVEDHGDYSSKRSTGLLQGSLCLRGVLGKGTQGA